MASYRSSFVLACCWLCSAAACQLSQGQTQGQTRQLSDLLPETTSFYVESMGTQAWLETPLVQSLTQSEVYGEIWRSPDVMKLRGGITLAELMLGERVTSLLARATADGLVLAGDVGTRGVVLIGDCRTKQACDALYQRLLKLAENDSKNPLQGNGFKQADYRGLSAYEVNQAIVVALDHWLIIANKAEFVRSIADHYLDNPQRSLSTNQSFAHERKQLGFDNTRITNAAKSENEVDRASTAAAWAWVNLEQFKAAGIGMKFFRGPRDNFLAQLLVGGIIATLSEAPHVAVRIDAQSTGLQVRLVTPHSADKPPKEYSYFYGSDGTGAAPHPVSVEGRVATLAVHRDLRGLWRVAGDLLDQRVNDQLAQADTTLTTLFSGRDFGEEILGALEPGWQLIVASNDFKDSELPVPEIKLPAFALVGKLRDPVLMQPQLKRIFTSLAGFVNVTGAINQQPQLDIDVVSSTDRSMVATHFEVEADRVAGRPVPVQFNFSPTMLQQQQHFVLASTRKLAEAIAQQMEIPQPVETTRTTATRNTLLVIDGQQLAANLSLNHDQLVSQNMTEKGHTQAEATKEIDMLIRIVKLIQTVEVVLDVDKADELRVHLDVTQH